MKPFNLCIYKPKVFWMGYDTNFWYIFFILLLLSLMLKKILLMPTFELTSSYFLLVYFCYSNIDLSSMADVLCLIFWRMNSVRNFSPFKHVLKQKRHFSWCTNPINKFKIYYFYVSNWIMSVYLILHMCSFFLIKKIIWWNSKVWVVC